MSIAVVGESEDAPKGYGGTLEDEHEASGYLKVLRYRYYLTPSLFLTTACYDLQTPRGPTVLQPALTDGQHDKVEI
jgi:hypothetical protein